MDNLNRPSTAYLRKSVGVRYNGYYWHHHLVDGKYRTCLGLCYGLQKFYNRTRQYYLARLCLLQQLIIILEEEEDNRPKD